MALSIHADATRKHPLVVAWVVTQDQDACDGQFVARLVTDAPTPYVLLVDTLGELRARLPPYLERKTGHHLVDPASSGGSLVCASG